MLRIELGYEGIAATNIDKDNSFNIRFYIYECYNRLQNASKSGDIQLKVTKISKGI